MNRIQRALRTDKAEHLDLLNGETAQAQRILGDLERWNALSGWNARHLRFIRQHWEALGRPEPFRVLDVGTGRGALLDLVRDAFQAEGVVVELTGVDLAQGYLDVARARLGPEPRLLLADATALPFDDQAFDLGTSLLMVHHLPQAVRPLVIAELQRTCRSAYVFDLELTAHGTLGFGLLATLLGFDPATRHDGMISVRRGSTLPEFRALTAGLPGEARRVLPSALAVLPS